MYTIGVIILAIVAVVLLQRVPKIPRLITEIAFTVVSVKMNEEDTWTVLFGLLVIIVLSVALTEEISNAKNIHGGGR